MDRALNRCLNTTEHDRSSTAVHHHQPPTTLGDSNRAGVLETDQGQRTIEGQITQIITD